LLSVTGLIGAGFSGNLACRRVEVGFSMEETFDFAGGGVVGLGRK